MKKRGFTLIELLVVIAIIALLLSIVMPALKKVKEAGRRAVCVSLLKSFGTANVAYATNNKDYFVPFSQPHSGLKEDGSAYEWDERWCENKEFRDTISVEARVEIDDSGWNDAFIFPKDLRCPSQKIKDIDEYIANTMATMDWQVVQSYALNTELWNGSGNISADSTWWPSGGYYGHRATRIKACASRMMFIDSNYYQTKYERANPDYWEGRNGTPGGESITRANMGQVAYRHGGNAGLVYFDGHASNLPSEEVWDENNAPPPFNVFMRGPVTLWDVE